MAAIHFSHVSKGYWLQTDKTFKEMLPSLLRGKPVGRKHPVIKDLSFSLEPGETLGVVGRNGAGKSTLLKLIAGVTSPDSGTIKVGGKVAPLIEVGAGFHHELSGYENIFLNGAILGMSREQLQNNIDDIIAFSELSDSIHEPVKRYSTGMYMRLGFSIAIHTDAPILLIDEVLAVGDIVFQEKCLEKLRELQEEKNRSIVFVSHDEAAVRAFCHRALLLRSGQPCLDGTVDEIFQAYHDSLSHDQT